MNRSEMDYEYAQLILDEIKKNNGVEHVGFYYDNIEREFDLSTILTPNWDDFKEDGFIRAIIQYIERLIELKLNDDSDYGQATIHFTFKNDEILLIDVYHGGMLYID